MRKKRKFKPKNLNHLHKIIAAAAFCLLSAPACRADGGSSILLGTRNGLSNNSVTSIFQDHYGFMWVGTGDGLNRYDGYSFTVYRNKLSDTLSLVSNRVMCLNEDILHRIWIGTPKGLCIYHPADGSFRPAYFHRSREPPGRLLNTIWAIKKDKRDNIFVAADKDGLIVFRGGLDAGFAVPCRAGDQTWTEYQVRDVEVDGQDRIWAFVQSIGLCRYDPGSASLQLVNRDITLAYCMASRGDTLWVGGDIGVSVYSCGQHRYQRFYPIHSRTLLSNRVVRIAEWDGRLWVATDGAGVAIIDEGTGAAQFISTETKDPSLPNNAIYTLFRDRDKRKWIGTVRNGIAILDPEGGRFSVVNHDPSDRNSLINNFVLSLCEEPSGKIWIGTDGSGLSYWDRGRNCFSNYTHGHAPTSLANDFVTSVLCDHTNTVWIAGYGGGIDRFDRRTGTFRHYACVSNGRRENNCWVLYEDRAGQLWAGTFEGSLYCYDRAADRFTLYDERLRNILSIMEDKNGDLWAGDINTLYRINRGRHTYTSYRIGSPVRCILEDRAGNFWVGTEGDGLLLFDRITGRYKRYSMEDGLSNNSVLRILEDDKGNLWISTLFGLDQLNPKRQKFTCFYESDGLPNNEFLYNAAIRTRKGELMFGSLGGAVIFQPDSIRPNVRQPALLLTALSMDNMPIQRLPAINKGRDLNSISEISVPFTRGAISVSFSAVEYTASDKISYAYYLEGWDKGWNYSGGNRTASYARLMEGSYTLHIKCTNAAGEWAGTERLLGIIVIPPWYRSKWAYILYGFGLIALLFLILFYTLRQAELKYEVRLAQVEAGKEKDLTERTMDFLTQISHEFRAPLSLIVNPLKEILERKDELVETREVGIVYRNARRLLGLVDQLLLFRQSDSREELRIARLDLADICQEVYPCFVQQAAMKGIDYRLECAAEPLELYGDREKLEIVLFNIISNGLKYTPEKGTVIVHAGERGNTVFVTVRDSGVGIPGNVGERLFEKFYTVRRRGDATGSGFGIGLYVAKQHMERHGAAISYTSEEEKGTTFFLEFKKGRAHIEPAALVAEATGRELTLRGMVADQEENMHLQAETGSASTDEAVTGGPVAGPRSMLIVDDDREMLAYVAGLFSAGFRILRSDSATAAMQLVRTHLPDIIICDVLMRDINGIEFCRMVKEDAALNHIPIILLTGSVDKDLKISGVACGADDYIGKPFENELLKARVSAVLQRRDQLRDYFFKQVTRRETNLRITEDDKRFLDRCIAIVERHIDDESLSTETLAKELGKSRSTLYKKLHSLSGQSVKSFIRYIRLRRAAELFVDSDRNVSEVLYGVGFSDVKYFRSQFRKLFGMNPSEYIKTYRRNFRKEFTVNERLIRKQKK
jgi:signal transduction histidine kinase/ligand-binding sensor domain-containing protein/DNA-binding response OmpR family regulator